MKKYSMMKLTESFWSLIRKTLKTWGTWKSACEIVRKTGGIYEKEETKSGTIFVLADGLRGA